jgi:CRISPR system Cascade subunit CasE
MSYFCRIQLDPMHPDAFGAAAALGAGGAYTDHQLLWQFFPAPPGTARDFLFRRMDAAGNRRIPMFYCVAPRAPVAPHPAWRVEARPYAPALRAGEELRFEVRINPVSAHKRANGKSQRDDVVMHAKKAIMQRHGAARWAEVPAADRTPLYQLAAQTVGAWFHGADGSGGLLARHGLRMLGGLQVDGYRQHEFARGGGKPARVSTVDLSGLVQVVEPMAAVRALLGGIGHAKGFGCGLLLVRRM